MWRIRTLGLLAGLMCAVVPVRGAKAQSSQSLTVARARGAEGCPDLERLAAQVVQLGGGDKAAGSTAYAVTFSRTPDGFKANIESSTGSTRTLEDRGTDCRALEQATAITLALLRDSDAEQTASTPADPDAPKAGPKAKPRQTASKAPRDAAEPTPHAPKVWLLGAAGAGLFGVVRPAAPALILEAGASFGRWRAHLGALAMLPQKLSLGPGTLRESLLSGVARGCFTALPGQSVRFDLCTGAYLGRTSIKARGFTRNESTSKTWLTIPIELAVVYAQKHYWAELGLSALIPLQSTDPAIDGLGRAYNSPPIGVLLALRIAYAMGG